MTLKSTKLSDYREEVQRCMRCGFCRVQCPTWSFLGWDSGAPRGRMQMAKALMDKKVELSDYIIQRFFECAQCGYCLWRCPAGVKTVDVIRAVRSYILEEKRTPENVETLLSNVRRHHNLYGLPHEIRTEWLSYPWIGLDGKVDVGKKGAEILYFVGCICSYSGAKNITAKATALILNGLKADWTILGGDEWCCGDPCLLVGEFDQAKVLAEHNVKEIERLGVEKVVTSCAGCYRTIREEYPALVGRELGFEVYHISQYLDKMLREGKLIFSKNLNSVLTYHDPCELGRLGKVFEEPRHVLASVPGVTLKELPKNRNLSRCCGGGGALKIADINLSTKVGVKRVDEAQSTGVDAIVSGCPACELQLTELSKKEGYGLGVMNIAEVVAKAMGLI